MPGYTLVQQLAVNTSTLVDQDGKVVHKWDTGHILMGGGYLLPNGDFLSTAVVQNSAFQSGIPGLTGIVVIYDWNGNVKWDFKYDSAKRTLHHDARMLPNGNVLLVGVEAVSKDEQIELGRDPNRIRNNMWFDFVIEVKPKGATEGEIVWEWNLKNHLIQEFDKSKKNYGVVADHPELMDINAIENPVEMDSNNLAHLQAIGYVGQSVQVSQIQDPLPDWPHVNAVAYNAKLDQIMLTARNLGEIWIVDHSTSKEEAVTNKGGKTGKGGSFLWRWGNPQTYQGGLPKGQILWGPHDAYWIEEGLPGAGNILIYNNGNGRPDGKYSSIEEVKSPVKPDGTYAQGDNGPFAEGELVWRYTSENKPDFFSAHLSGAQRLANGNTLICAGEGGRVFEVNNAGKTVWEPKLTHLSSNQKRRSGGGSRSGPPGSGYRDNQGPGGMGMGPSGGPPLREDPLGIGGESFSEDPLGIGPGMGGPGQGGPGMGGPGMGGPGMGGPGQGGPGRGGPGQGGSGPPGSSGPSSLAFFRATKYSLDYAAFGNRKLVPLPEEAAESAPQSPRPEAGPSDGNAGPEQP